MSRLPGPPRQPTELKVLRGNPGKRKLPDSPRGQLPADIPAPPAALGRAGLRAWELYWRHGRPWLALTDMPHVERLCFVLDMAAEMEEAIRTEGLTFLSPRTKRSSPHYLLNNLLGLYKLIGELEATCGFTPSDRARMKAAPQEADALDRWLAGER